MVFKGKTLALLILTLAFTLSGCRLSGSVKNEAEVSSGSGTEEVIPVHRPSLTAVDPNFSTDINSAITISYTDLINAADEYDSEGHTITFRIEAVDSGTLSHSVDGAVSPGVTFIESGESVTWTPDIGARGLGITAFTIVAYDTKNISDPVPVPVDVIEDYTWVGRGSDSNWNTAANWPRGLIPGATEVAKFDSTCANCDVTINTSITVQGIDIQAAYTGTITQSSGQTITVGTSDWVQAGGTFQGGNSAIDVRKFTLSGGTFISTSGELAVGYNVSSLPATDGFTITGGTFTHNSGTVRIKNSASVSSSNKSVCEFNAPAGTNFNNLIIDVDDTWSNYGYTGVYVNLTNSINVLGNYTLRNGYVVGTVDLKGNLVVECADGASGRICGQGSVQNELHITGDTTQTYSVETGGGAPFITINTSGSFSPAAGTTSLSVPKFKLQSGTFNAPASMNVGYFVNATAQSDGFTINGGVFNHSNGTVSFVPSGSKSGGGSVTALTIDAPVGVTFYNLTIAPRDTNSSGGYNQVNVVFTAGQTITVSNTLRLQDGYMSSGAINFQGNLAIECADGASGDSCFSAGSTTEIIYTGSAASTYSWQTGARGPDLTVNATGSLSAAGGVTELDIQKLKIQNGTFNAPSYMKLGYAIGGAGDQTDGFVVSGGTFNHNSGTVEFDGSAYTNNSKIVTLIDAPGLNLNNVVINTADGYHLGGWDDPAVGIQTGQTINILGNLTVKDGNLLDGVINLYGNLILECADGQVCASGPSTSELVILGNTAQTYSSVSGTRAPAITVNTTGSFAPAVGTTEFAMNKFKLQNGTFTAPNYMKVGYSISLAANQTDGFVVSGGTFNHSSGTIEFDGSAYTNTTRIVTLIDAPGLNFNNVVINTADGYHLGGWNDPAVGVQSGQSINILGNLTVKDGNLLDGTINLYGNLTFECTDSQVCASGPSTSEIVILGNTTQTYSWQTGARGPKLIINTTGSFAPAAGTTGFAINKLELISGTFTAPTGTLTIGYALPTSVNETEGFIVSGGTFNHNSGTVEFDGTVNTTGAYTVTYVSAPGLSLNNLVVNVTDTYFHTGYNGAILELGAGQTLNVLGNLTLRDGRVDSGTLNVSGNLSIECADGSAGSSCAQEGTVNITFAGGAAQTFTKATGGLEPDGTFTVNKSAGTLSLLSQMDLDATGQDLQVLGGTLSLGAFDLRLDDQLTVDTPGVVDASGAGSVVYINGGCSGTGVCP